MIVLGVDVVLVGFMVVFAQGLFANFGGFVPFGSLKGLSRAFLLRFSICLPSRSYLLQNIKISVVPSKSLMSMPGEGYQFWVIFLLLLKIDCFNQKNTSRSHLEVGT